MREKIWKMVPSDYLQATFLHMAHIERKHGLKQHEFIPYTGAHQATDQDKAKAFIMTEGLN